MSTTKFVAFRSDWPEDFNSECIVSAVRYGETDDEAIERVRKNYDLSVEFFVVERKNLDDENV